jgi:Flp pilus assembly protein TadG
MGWKDDDSGATAVEFAIVGPIFLIMLIGIVQLSIAYFHGSSVQWAVDRAMRTAMVDADITSTEVENLIAASLGDINPPEIELTFSIDTSGEIHLAHVVANYEIPVQILFMPEFAVEFSVEAYVPVPS